MINEYICEICGKIFSKEEYSKPKLAYTKHLDFCQWRKQLLDGENIKREDLNSFLDQYGSVSNMFRELSPKYGRSINAYFKLFKEDNIDTSIKRSNNSNQVKEKRKQTNLEKYGSAHNFCKDHPSRKAWEKRLLEEEGITNVFQRDSVKLKAMETMIEKYGVKHPAQSEAFKVTENYLINKHGEELGRKLWKDLCYNRGKSMRPSYYIEKYGEELGLQKWQERYTQLQRHYSTSKISSLNIKFKQLLQTLNIEFEEEFCIWLDDTNARFYDFKIDNYIFELNGDFWHAFPEKYSKQDILHFPGGDVTAEEIWEKDRIKKELAESQGYKVIYYWEHDINNNEIWNLIVKKLTQYANIKNKKYQKSSNN